MSFGKCFTMFKTKLDVRSLFDAHFSTDTTKVLSLLARYIGFSTFKCHKKNTTWQRDRQSNGNIFRQMAPLESAQFETYWNFWISPCRSQINNFWENRPVFVPKTSVPRFDSHVWKVPDSIARQGQLWQIKYKIVKKTEFINCGQLTSSLFDLIYIGGFRLCWQITIISQNSKWKRCWCQNIKFWIDVAKISVLRCYGSNQILQIVKSFGFFLAATHFLIKLICPLRRTPQTSMALPLNTIIRLCCSTGSPKDQALAASAIKAAGSQPASKLHCTDKVISSNCSDSL